MFPSIEPDTETAVTVPKVVARMLVNIARNVKRNAVIEHIAEQVLVGVARHNHKPVVVRLPTVQHNDIPIPVLSIYIVVCAAHGALGADNLFDERFEFRTSATYSITSPFSSLKLRTLFERTPSASSSVLALPVSSP